MIKKKRTKEEQENKTLEILKKSCIFKGSRKLFLEGKISEEFIFKSDLNLNWKLVTPIKNI